MIPDELTCKEAVQLVVAYLEQRLLPEVQARFEGHLAECPGCATYLEQIQQTIRLLRELAEEPLMQETTQERLELFRQWKNHL
jgi:anti-sigma factor RsiW